MSKSTSISYVFCNLEIIFNSIVENDKISMKRSSCDYVTIAVVDYGLALFSCYCFTKSKKKSLKKFSFKTCLRITVSIYYKFNKITLIIHLKLQYTIFKKYKNCSLKFGTIPVKECVTCTNGKFISRRISLGARPPPLSPLV